MNTSAISTPSSIITHLEGKVRLAGHSMGGILSCLYAGIRPERVASVMTLEGFGIAPTTPDMATERYSKWLDTLKRPPRMHVYADRPAFASRLQRDNRFLSAERAGFLSHHLAREGDGDDRHGVKKHGIIWNGDPWHKASGPYLFRLEESMAVWKQVTCPGALGGRASILGRQGIRHSPRRLGGAPAMLRQSR